MAAQLKNLVVADHWAARLFSGEMTEASAARYQRVFAAFERFAAAHGCADLQGADSGLCEQFAYAQRVNGTAPAAATSRFRLTVLRDAFDALGGPAANPTRGLSVTQGPQAKHVCPLRPTEAARLRASGRVSPRDHLRPAAVELALAGASHMEIASAAVADLDLAAGVVALGSRSTKLDAFARSTLANRVAACRRAARRRREAWQPDRVALALARPFDTYPATSIAPGVSSSLSRALDRAGIRRSGVRAASIREYGANRVYALSGRVEEVAAFLGLRSLDAAMGFIDNEWQTTFGDEVRA